MTSNAPGQMEKILHEGRFMQMFGEFTNWRMDVFIRQMEADKRKGRVLPFVRGLRLSAQLIYVIRVILTGSDLTANWGHLLHISKVIYTGEIFGTMKEALTAHFKSFRGDVDLGIVDRWL